MRPLRLEVEGFTAFRQPVVVDFEGADLFALTGATGAGKTSVLDAIVFALYGIVPRLGDERQVVGAIAQGLAEARVRLDFTAGGETYTAVRVVRRTKAGATTAEARLQQGEKVLAGNAKELNDEVARLLGLSYAHFTKCVVLPQGEFARFLHDKPKDRQELLVSLLDLGVYGLMASLAGERGAVAKREVTGLDARLAEVAGATPEALADAEQRVAAIATLLSEVEAIQPRLAALAAAEAAARDEAVARAVDADRLAAVVVPEAFAEHAAELAEAMAGAERLAAAVNDAEAATEAAELALTALPDRAELERRRGELEEHARHLVQQTKGEAALAERQAEVDATSAAVAAAEAALAAAQAAEERANAAHRAHAVRADVVIGEPCPVCAQTVASLPDEPAPPALSATTTARKTAKADVDRAAAAHRAAADQLAHVDGKLASIAAQLAELAPRLGDGPDLAGVEAALADVAAAGAALAAARAAEKSERAALVKAQAAVDAARTREAEARAVFDAARDTVAALGAPPRLGAAADLAAEWDALVAWASAEVPLRRVASEQAAQAAAATAADAADLRAALVARCAEAGVDTSRADSPRDAVVDASARAESARERVAEQLATAERVQVERAAAAERTDVAYALHRHLNATNFEKWILDEALVALADGATELLLMLSGGQYSLQIDTRGFAVVDHRNADEPRSARTLSGGETFLASLALALALADRIAGLAAGGAARLDAIFLDEGFGTLDPATLDVVAAAIEELGASGRMVGVVSHVAELAERVPVRFEVTRMANSSTVERIER